MTRIRRVMTEESVTLQFEKSHACVIFKNELSEATGCYMPKLFVQAIDEYSFQREWTLQLTVDILSSPSPLPSERRLVWESHIYMHPDRRCQVELGQTRAVACIRRFLEQASHYPDLLFNQRNERYARNHGFVVFAERLHRGRVPSKTML